MYHIYKAKNLHGERYISHYHRLILRKAAAIFSSDGPVEKFPLRATQLDNGIFTSSERRIVAECLIRAYDKLYEYHCDEMECGDTCLFSRHECPHDGCTAIYSLKWKDNHDAICPYIIIPCPRECGVEIARRNLDVSAQIFGSSTSFNLLL